MNDLPVGIALAKTEREKKIAFLYAEGTEKVVKTHRHQSPPEHTKKLTYIKFSR
jgi:hypothetical protein